MSRIKKLAVFTSGGDAPGMNAAIRAVVRGSLSYNLEIVGIKRGYKGMINNDFLPLDSKSVGHIIQRGGTILGTARCPEFTSPEGRAKAYENLKKNEVDAAIVIGGDGSFKGAGIFSAEYDIPFVGIPGTIDNDMYGTDFTIGFDTALNTVTEAIDRIKDTAASHDRIFFVEVMGRDAGFIAVRAGIAIGAEAVLIPEINDQETKLVEYINRNPNKRSHIFIVAEGNKSGGANVLTKAMQKKFPERSIRSTVLGHTQRGGSPTAFDRFLASRLGVAAVDALMDNQRSVMVGYTNHEVIHIPFNKTIKGHRNVSPELLRVSDILTI